MKCDRLSEYKTMWLMVLFDLPTETKKQKKAYTHFRKSLISNGFRMFQFSIYCRPCASRESTEVYIKRLSLMMPEEGKVCVMSITDKQFANIKIFEGYKKIVKPDPPTVQLELF